MHEKIKLSEITAGEVKHAALPDQFVERVKAYKAKLSEVEPSTIAATVDSFQRDTNPERELKIWERIADTYTIYISQNRVEDNQTKKEVFASLLGISMAGDEYGKIMHLTPEQIKALAYNYRGL